jgi:hypothetical protein
MSQELPMVPVVLRLPAAMLLAFCALHGSCSGPKNGFSTGCFRSTISNILFDVVGKRDNHEIVHAVAQHSIICGHNSEVVIEDQLARDSQPLGRSDKSGVNGVVVSLEVLWPLSVRPLSERVNERLGLALVKREP